MNIFRLSLSGLRFHALSNLFNIITLALGVATIVTLLHISTQMQDRFERDLSGIDLVVSGKGSPLQIILSSVFHLDVPTGNIPLKEADKLTKNMLVKSAIPLALGDSYHTFRIVGTTPDYASHYNASLVQGKFWSAPMQVVLGADAATTTGLALGAHFAGSHGLTEGGEEHSAFPYEVVGILAPTGSVIDRLILTDVASVWNVHEHHHHDKNDKDDDDDDDNAGQPHEREITALLISYKSPLAAATLPRLINSNGAMQAASPAMETARFMHNLGMGADIIQLFGGLLMLLAALGFFITLFHAVNDRRYDIALMRALGASRTKIVLFVLTEGLILAVAGLVLGLVLGHILAACLQHSIEQARHMSLAPVGIHPYEWVIVLVALLLSILASLIPALMAYRIRVADTLSKGA